MRDALPALPEFEASFSAISEQLQGAIGHRLLTASRVGADGFNERIYSSQASMYPVQGRKPRDQTEWTAMMERGECFVANHPDEFGPHFFDLQAIVAQGFGAVVNVPILDGARLLGTLNLLDREGAYRGPVLDACLAVREQARQAFLQYDEWVARRSA